MQATLIHSRTKHQKKKYLNDQIIKEKSHTKLFKSLYLLFTSLLGHTLNIRQRVSRMEHTCKTIKYIVYPYFFFLYLFRDMLEYISFKTKK